MTTQTKPFVYTTDFYKWMQVVPRDAHILQVYTRHKDPRRCRATGILITRYFSTSDDTHGWRIQWPANTQFGTPAERTAYYGQVFPGVLLALKEVDRRTVELGLDKQLKRLTPLTRWDRIERKQRREAIEKAKLQEARKLAQQKEQKVLDYIARIEANVI